MDSKTPEGEAPTDTRKPERIALNVLALCFVLALLGRGLSESFTVFLKPISESFGWDRAQVVSVYSLSGWRRADGAGDRPVFRPLRSSHGIFARPVPDRRRVPGGLVGADAVAIAGEHRSLRRHRRRLRSATCRIRFCSAAGSVRGCRRRWPSSIPRGRRRSGAAAGIAASDRSHRLARRLPAVRHRHALHAAAAVPAAVADAGPRRRPASPGRPTPSSSTATGRLAARCGTTPSGRCSRPSSSRRSGCTRCRRRSSPI